MLIPECCEGFRLGAWFFLTCPETGTVYAWSLAPGRSYRGFLEEHEKAHQRLAQLQAERERS